MIHFNNDNNAYCSAVNAQNLRQDSIIQYKQVHSYTRAKQLYNCLPLHHVCFYTRNLYFYSHLEIFICIYSVRGETDQISTNTFRYTTFCAANVYMFVYILIGAHIVPLRFLIVLCRLIYPGLCINANVFNHYHRIKML